METIRTERNLPFDGAFNFRDVGGYSGLDGRSVRWGRLYRSDSLHRLESEDWERFAALGVRTVIDLRRPYEITRDGRVREYDWLDYRNICPEHAEWTESAFEEGQTLEQWLSARYLDLADEGQAGLVRAVEVIADAEAAPVVVHCLAGKDRTGVVCGLTLSLLGVSDGDIAEDYELSTAAAERFTAWLFATYPEAARELPAPYLASPAKAMLLFLAGLRERYGSVERYLTDGGLAAERIPALRAHLLTGD